MKLKELKRKIEEIVGFEIFFDEKGLVVKYLDITYYVGYENQSLILSNSKNNAKAIYTTNAVESILRNFRVISQQDYTKQYYSNLLNCKMF